MELEDKLFNYNKFQNIIKFTNLKKYFKIINMFNKFFLEKFIEYENATKLLIIKFDDMKPQEKKLSELIEKQKNKLIVQNIIQNLK
jgi:hypothetical protein